MDLKGLVWIGNIYEKFEAMCLDMEEVMYQDTVKYVENQVQTVGASVKRFYSEVMQDLDPEAHIDPVKVAAADLSLNPYAHAEMKRKSSSKKDLCESTERFIDDYKVISGKNKIGAYKRPIARRRGHSSVNYSPTVSGSIVPNSGNVTSTSLFPQRRGSHEVASSCVELKSSSAAIEGNSGESKGKISKGNFGDAKEKIGDQVVDTGVPLSSSSVISPLAEIKLSTLSSGRKNADPGQTSYSSCLATGSCTNRGDISQIDQAIKGDAGLSKSVEDDVMMSYRERLDDCSRDAAKCDDIIDQEVEIVEKFNESDLAETCVLVEDDILHFIHKGDDKHKSYKKKLWEAFSTKKRSTRLEYEKLAAQYKEHNSNQEGAELLMPVGDSNAKISPPRNCPESEWELI